MATVTKSFDVKISIVRPYITKDLSQDDFTKINQTTALKYETLKTTAPQGSLGDAELSDDEVAGELSNTIKETEAIYDAFDELQQQSEKELNAIVYTYDVSLAENEMIANAERALFGSASGVITFAKYKKVMAFQTVLQREISERMVNNGGILNVA